MMWDTYAILIVGVEVELLTVQWYHHAQLQSSTIVNPEYKLFHYHPQSAVSYVFHCWCHIYGDHQNWRSNVHTRVTLPWRILISLMYGNTVQYSTTFNEPWPQVCRNIYDIISYHIRYDVSRTQCIYQHHHACVHKAKWDLHACGAEIGSVAQGNSEVYHCSYHSVIYQQRTKNWQWSMQGSDIEPN